MFLHRRIATNDFLLKICLKAESCSFCREFTETLAHLFWYCKYTKKFWKDIYQWITQNSTLNKAIALSPFYLSWTNCNKYFRFLLHNLFLLSPNDIFAHVCPVLQVYIQTAIEIGKEIASNNNNISSFKNKRSPLSTLKLCPYLGQINLLILHKSRSSKS